MFKFILKVISGSLKKHYNTKTENKTRNKTNKQTHKDKGIRAKGKPYKS